MDSVQHAKDLITTGTGGVSGLYILSTVDWSHFPGWSGDALKIGVALALLIMGKRAYSQPTSLAAKDQETQADAETH